MLLRTPRKSRSVKVHSCAPRNTPRLAPKAGVVKQLRYAQAPNRFLIQHGGRTLNQFQYFRISKSYWQARSFSTASPGQPSTPSTVIKIDELIELIDGEKNDPYVLIDVREPNECAQGMIPTAYNVPRT